MFSSLYSDLRKLRKVASPSEVKQIKQARFQLLFKTKKEKKPQISLPKLSFLQTQYCFSSILTLGGKTYI